MSFHSDQMVLMMVRQEAGPCERRLNSRATFSDDKSTYSFSWVSDERELLSMKIDDDEG